MFEPKLLINGSFISTNETVDIYNPSNNEVIARVPLINDPVAIDDVFKNAHLAFLDYQKTSVTTRVNLLNKFADAILTNKEELANLLVLEIAKSKKDSLSEVVRTAEYMYDTIKAYEEMMNNPLSFDEKILNTPNKSAIYTRVPLGVVLAISPFNYPLNLLMTKLAPALVAGNTVVFKPATQGSLVGLKIAELAQQVGYPKGTVNSLMTNARLNGDRLASNEYVRVINFTGSAPVGNHLATVAKRANIFLELGGKDPALVLDDADLNSTAAEIIKGAFSYSGQRCTAIKRVFVSQKNHDELVKLLKEHALKLTVGLPENNSDIVPLINKKSVQYNLELIKDAVDKKAVLMTQVEVDEAHNLLSPVLIDQVTPDMRVAWEEPFGPILPIITYENVEQAIQWINQSEYGLQGSIFTTNYEQAAVYANQIETGTVNINKASSRGPDLLPFLGVKNSGFGVQGVKDALISVTSLKGLVINK
ncbi:aldehyde dehydrogenase family protein [Ureaplasma sp. ES3154-GEN]|uniref:aldehyde dehydrogenase family protein n=1 Tax=Ureaplasma sp. ES3154-GEN TaxID=2984844 RepID=UPI0021E824C1|nr:aldehyde dehydrogenase family protein [Ureaplasma sp. ES3154-GEN]MCV3743585.1 aldehyde dehydrogenase family protein [Ureaplasma sp. ES3154-GEN]